MGFGVSGAGTADPGSGVGTDPGAPASKILQSTALLQEAPPDQVTDTWPFLTIPTVQLAKPSAFGHLSEMSRMSFDHALPFPSPVQN